MVKLFRRNLGPNERWLRAAAGLAVAIGGPLSLGLTPPGWVMAAAGAGLAFSGLSGFCPACAMVGRRWHDNNG